MHSPFPRVRANNRRPFLQNLDSLIYRVEERCDQPVVMLVWIWIFQKQRIIARSGGGSRRLGGREAGRWSWWGPRGWWCGRTASAVHPAAAGAPAPPISGASPPPPPRPPIYSGPPLLARPRPGPTAPSRPTLTSAPLVCLRSKRFTPPSATLVVLPPVSPTTVSAPYFTLYYYRISSSRHIAFDTSLAGYIFKAEWSCQDCLWFLLKAIQESNEGSERRSLGRSWTFSRDCFQRPSTRTFLCGRK